MSPRLRLRLLTPEDLGFADSVRALAGWNQTLEDWRRFLATEPTGCFLAEWDGIPAGTATTTVYGPELAWIGMVLVHPDYRRRGIGRALLEHCLEHLRRQGVRSIKLDATPEGRLVYEQLGFRDEWSLRRWASPGNARNTIISTQPRWIRSWRESDAASIEALDVAAFGISRGNLLARLARQSTVALVVEPPRQSITGWGMLRPGARARYLGPAVAVGVAADHGLQLIEALLARAEGQPVYWDIPDPNAAASAWAEAHGFTVQRSLMCMALGAPTVSDKPHLQFALGGPEIG